MKETVCPYMGDLCGPNGEECSLITMLKNQSEAGSFLIDSVSGESGRFWPRASWNALVERTTIFARDNACLMRDEISAKAASITTRKIEKGELR
jgi:hypothetical protein